MKNEPYTDEEGCYYKSYAEYIWIGMCGFCGCYDLELYDDFFAVLKSFDNDEHYIYYGEILKGEPRKYIELILHILDSNGLVEHGTAIRGSWLSEKGKEIINKLFH